MIMQPLMMRGRLTLSELIKVIRLKSMHVSAQMHGTNVSKRSLCFKLSQRHPRNFGEPRNQTNFLACSCGKCVLFWRLPLQLASYVAHSGRHVSGRSIWLVSYIGVRYQDLLTITRVNLYQAVRSIVSMGLKVGCCCFIVREKTLYHDW